MNKNFANGQKDKPSLESGKNFNQNDLAKKTSAIKFRYRTHKKKYRFIILITSVTLVAIILIITLLSVAWKKSGTSNNSLPDFSHSEAVTRIKNFFYETFGQENKPANFKWGNEKYEQKNKFVSKLESHLYQNKKDYSRYNGYIDTFNHENQKPGFKFKKLDPISDDNLYFDPDIISYFPVFNVNNTYQNTKFNNSYLHYSLHTGSKKDDIDIPNEFMSEKFKIQKEIFTAKYEKTFHSNGKILGSYEYKIIVKAITCICEQLPSTKVPLQENYLFCLDDDVSISTYVIVYKLPTMDKKGKNVFGVIPSTKKGVVNDSFLWIYSS